MKIKLLIAILCFVAFGATAAEREKVLGFGGVFFKAENPKALALWYEEHLGVKQTPTTYEEMPWVQAGGSVIPPF